MNASHGVPAAQFRTARQALQHLAPDLHVISDDMTGTPLYTHPFALTVTEQDLDRHAMMSDDNAPAPGNKVGGFAGSATGACFYV
jgi:hypothetical protein